jgi:ureidoacrylate peracid hydrolase
MHKVEIAPRIIERILERRGRLHPFEQIDCSRTAHVVVDLQNGFMAPGQRPQASLTPGSLRR